MRILQKKECTYAPLQEKRNQMSSLPLEMLWPIEVSEEGYTFER